MSTEEPRREGAPAMARRLGTAVADLLWPAQCLVSRRIVAAPGALAPESWKALAFIDRPYCSQCGRPFPYDVGADMICTSCLSERRHFERARAPLVYNDALARMLIQFKWGDRMDGVATFARWMCRAGAELLAAADVMAPVPLHISRLVMRRYNQSALLAQALARLSTTPVIADLLVRTRRTPVLKRKSPAERRRNVAGAFVVKPARATYIADKRVLLIDDVLTTGATANACAKALKRAGAAQVDVLTLARVVSATRVHI